MVGREAAALHVAQATVVFDLIPIPECLTLPKDSRNRLQNDSTRQTQGFAMEQAIAVRTDFTSEEVRQLAARTSISWSASLGNPLSFFPTGGQAHAGKAPTRSCRT
jgi:hypothetical protein